MAGISTEEIEDMAAALVEPAGQRCSWTSRRGCACPGCLARKDLGRIAFVLLPFLLGTEIEDGAAALLRDDQAVYEAMQFC